MSSASQKISEAYSCFSFDQARWAVKRYRLQKSTQCLPILLLSTHLHWLLGTRVCLNYQYLLKLRSGLRFHLLVARFFLKFYLLKYYGSQMQVVRILSIFSEAPHQRRIIGKMGLAYLLRHVIDEFQESAWPNCCIHALLFSWIRKSCWSVRIGNEPFSSQR